MKSIGNIYLAWRKDANSPRILVGVIKKNTTEGVRFFYLVDGAIEARRLGFEAYSAFPDVIKVYTENVLRIFGQRILQAARPDKEAYFDFWHINSEFKSKPFYMLAYTQAMLPSDNFEFLASFNPRKDFSLVTELCNVASKNFPADILKEGDVLRYVYERKNETAKLYKGNTAVGEVKVVHSRIFSKVKNLIVRIHKLEPNEIGDRVFVRISRA